MKEYKNFNEMIQAFLEAAELPEITEYAKKFMLRAVPYWANKLNVPEMSLVINYIHFKGFIACENLTRANLELCGL